MKYTFSGHESFQCRHLWLKKGFDHIKKGRLFSDIDSVLELGVGKNMVTSIRFWMKAFNIIDPNTDQLTEFALKLLSDDTGWDPFLEDEASIWLLHYQLIKTGYATTFPLIFNELRKEKVEFTKGNYLAFIKRKAEENKFQISPNTLNDDFDILIKTYIKSDTHTKDKEDTFSGILCELGLIKTIGRGKNEYYVVENTEKDEIPDEVILFTILDNENTNTSISFHTIEQEPNSPGVIFALNRSGLLNKIESISKKYKEVVFKDDAGIKEIQIKKKLNPLSVLEKYYEN